MKVTNSDTAALTGAAQAARAAASSAPARARTAVAQKSSDNVQLSNLSGHLRGVTAEGRQTQLESIGATVASGHYKPDSNAISAKIIQHNMRSGAAA
jgi:anti-sigma28 factor (negative regulator of flagellin synthesis)